MPQLVIGEGKSEYYFRHRDNPNETVVVKQNDDERTNESGNESEAEEKLNAYFGGEKRGHFEYTGKKAASVVVPKQIAEDERADVKLEEVS